jgi:hypothetical protein
VLIHTPVGGIGVPADDHGRAKFVESTIVGPRSLGLVLPNWQPARS